MKGDAVATRVLVVDDAAFMRHLIKKILTDMGYEVAGEACDGEEACEKYKAIRPDLVTMDLVMPKMGGLDALKAIREEDPNAKVIVISAIDQREPLMDALNPHFSQRGSCLRFSIGWAGAAGNGRDLGAFGGRNSWCGVGLGRF